MVIKISAYEINVFFLEKNIINYEPTASVGQKQMKVVVG